MNLKRKSLNPSDLAPIWSFLVKRIRRQVLVSKQTVIDEPTIRENPPEDNSSRAGNAGEDHGTV